MAKWKVQEPGTGFATEIEAGTVRVDDGVVRFYPEGQSEPCAVFVAHDSVMVQKVE